MPPITATFTLSIKGDLPPSLLLTPDGGALTDGVVGTPIVDELVTTITGGTAPYSFSLSGGALPDGTSLSQDDNPSGGTDVFLEGTPTTAGNFSFDLTVTDASGSTVTTAARRHIL